VALAGLAGLVVASGAAAHARPGASLLPLRAAPDPVAGGRIVDARGRTVTLRGVNVNALAEYWKGTRFPTVFPLERRDPARMQRIGWDAVRLLLSWSRVEPAPGRYDERYLTRVAATVRRLARHRIYTILDMHQDAWGASPAAPPGTVCPSGTLPGLGWDGAPAWATLDGGKPRCYSGGVREANPAVMQAWASFWADARGPGGVGVRTRFVRMWGHVAARFAREPSVAGYDLLNEPGALAPGEPAAMSATYGEALAAIRRAERARRGLRHLVLFEPSVLFSAVGSGAPPDFPRDRDVVYAPHIYTGGFTNGPITSAAFETAIAEARGFGGAPVLSGEWGGDPGRAAPGGDHYFRSHQDLQDRFGVSATRRESCGDPHKVADYRAGRIPDVWGEWDVRCTDNVVRGPRSDLVRELTRAYVRAAPGLAAQRYDETTGAFSATGRAARGAGAIEVFYPRAPGFRVRVSVTGASPAGSLGIGVARFRPAGGPWRVSYSRR